jgi:hypothetical protein
VHPTEKYLDGYEMGRNALGMGLGLVVFPTLDDRAY